MRPLSTRSTPPPAPRRRGPRGVPAVHYALTDDGWKQAGALPQGLAYGASFSVPEGLLIVGSEDGEGNPRTDVFEVRWDGSAISVID